jgi:hypothetical protein
VEDRQPYVADGAQIHVVVDVVGGEDAVGDAVRQTRRKGRPIPRQWPADVDEEIVD